ncbi:hypothetical protein HY642_02040 [Candidatus Woesearchaeota archaeon]|nr:hypothetical protein [Candidatus Woesearchaeota archaeon]
MRVLVRLLQLLRDDGRSAQKGAPSTDVQPRQVTLDATVSVVFAIV